MDENIGIGKSVSDLDDEISGYGNRGPGEAGEGNTGGNGQSSVSGTGARRRGRPRKVGTQEEDVYLLNPGETPTRTKRRGKKSGISANDLANNISTISNLIASFNRPWWQMTAQETLPLAEPLAEGLEQLPPELIESVSKVSLPLSIIVGALIVFHKPVLEEYKRAHKSNAGNTNPQPIKNNYPSGTGTGERTTNGVHTGNRENAIPVELRLPSASD